VTMVRVGTLWRGVDLCDVSSLDILLTLFHD
jgi:hypothetical protein